MFRLITILAGVLTAFTLLVTASQSWAGQDATNRGLRENSRIDRALTDMTAAYGISLYCPSISARYGRGYEMVRRLERHAISLGYPKTEVHAYVKDKTERKRVKAQARNYLRSKGARDGDRESICRQGRAEIAAKSQIGLLLRSR